MRTHKVGGEATLKPIQSNYPAGMRMDAWHCIRLAIRRVTLVFAALEWEDEDPEAGSTLDPEVLDELAADLATRRGGRGQKR